MKQKQVFVANYSNKAKFAVTYDPNPDPLYPFEDRIQLDFQTEHGKKLGVRMTFAEATLVAQYLLTAANKLLDDRENGSDIPLSAGE